tara:strand:- start:587 stop:835 length:249 start_codon:yes stop_codon:yes gene_type:complete
MYHDTRCKRLTVATESEVNWNSFCVRCKKTIDNIEQIRRAPYSIINKKRLIDTEITLLNWILKEDANTAIGILGSTSYKGAR